MSYEKLAQVRPKEFPIMTPSTYIRSFSLNIRIPCAAKYISLRKQFSSTGMTLTALAYNCQYQFRLFLQANVGK